MKKFLLLSAAFLLFVPAWAVVVKSGSFKEISTVSSADVVFDFSQVIIDGMSLQEFKSTCEVDEDFDNWEDFTKYIMRRFMAGLNGKSYRISDTFIFRLCSTRDSAQATIDDSSDNFLLGTGNKYSILVSPIMMNIDGTYKILYSLVDNTAGKVLATAFDQGDGGVFGCFSNLQGDGFEEAGELLGSFLGREARKKANSKSRF